MVSRQVCTVALLLLCGFIPTHASVYQVSLQNSNRYKIDHLTDGNLQHALRSIAAPSNVKELDLSGNPLSRISANDLNAFTNLELLNLSSNVLFETVDLGSLPKLHTVDLNNNFIKRVVVGSGIETLHAANNHITLVSCNGQSSYRGTESRTKKIYLANNKITSLQDLGNSCRNRVEYLDVRLNEIEILNFGDLSASQDTLEYLLMDYNFIYEVRTADGISFRKLEKLDLSSNKLAFMGPEFRAAINAKSIILKNNKLVLLNDIHFREAHTVDLRGNWLQCESLRKFLGIDKQPNKNANKNTRRYSNPVGEEPCNNQSEVKRVGIYCCDELSAPFADRLIDLKRKELALYSGQSTENDRKECELEKQARQRKINEVQTKYSTTINEDAKRQQQKIKLTNEKIVLEKSISETDLVITDLQNLLNETASNLQLDPSITNQGPLQLLRAIVQWYEEQYEKEQIVQNNAIRDFDRYQQTIEEKLEENTRLKKVNNDAEQALVAANQTNIMLEKREQDLAKILREAV